MDVNEEEKWDLIINADGSSLSNFREVLHFRDLLGLLVKRDFVAFYKQTILGPVWFLLQPIFTLGVYVFLFGRVAKLSTEAIPAPLFYLLGIIVWSFFSESLKKVSVVLMESKDIIGKVYFPRIIMPISIIISSLVRFGFQLALLLIFIFYFHVATSFEFQFRMSILLAPLFLFLISLQSLGIGLLISGLTIKYRDIALLVTFGLQLAMYATTVVYPLSALEGNLKLMVSIVPTTYIIEGLRNGFFGSGVLTEFSLFYSFLCSILLLFAGFSVFNRYQRNFIDSI